MMMNDNENKSTAAANRLISVMQQLMNHKIEINIMECEPDRIENPYGVDGYYYPEFKQIEVFFPKGKEIDAELMDTVSAVLLHEYGHYLLDKYVALKEDPDFSLNDYDEEMLAWRLGRAPSEDPMDPLSQDLDIVPAIYYTIEQEFLTIQSEL